MHLYVNGTYLSNLREGMFCIYHTFSMKITTVCSSLVFTTTYIHGFPSAAKGYFFFEGGPAEIFQTDP